MSESILEADVRTLRSPEAGVLMTVVTSISTLLEKVTVGSFDVVKTVRGELFRVTGAGIDWLEGVQQATFKITREIVHRFDGLSREAVDGSESIASALVGTVRGSSEAVGKVVSRTAESLMGRRAVEPKAA